MKHYSTTQSIAYLWSCELVSQCLNYASLPDILKTNNFCSSYWWVRHTLHRSAFVPNESRHPSETVHSCSWLTHMALVDISWRHRFWRHRHGCPLHLFVFFCLGEQCTAVSQEFKLEGVLWNNALDSPQRSCRGCDEWHQTHRFAKSTSQFLSDLCFR